MTRKDTLRAGSYVALVFAAGAAFGFAAGEFYHAQTAEAVDEGPATASQYRRNLLEELDEQLNLDIDQESEILEILDEVGERFWEVRDAMEPEFEAIRQERAARIMALLSPAQRVEYQQILDERRRKAEEEQAKDERFRNN